MLKKIFISLALMVSIYALPAGAASVSYFMDQSNALPDGVNYLQVTISDRDGVEGIIDFTVETLPVFNFNDGSNFGITAFGFNGDLLTADNISLPDGWSFSSDQNRSGFGNFINFTSGTGNSREDPLKFSIIGDDINSYTGFTAHVAGFITSDEDLTSDWFGGSVSTSTVPVPAAVWLFGSGLLGLIGVARRRSK
ncbi:MAG: VPLPA-CTERM sorting domain-containing protein [Gammaproteobacteria bacterium]|nr:VPLPA-CTERM sorting domain-containing protein [Gammaproteobacteria bacterium]